MTIVDTIAETLEELEPLVSESLKSELKKGINRVKFLPWEDRTAWKKYADENVGWIPTWVIDDDGLVLRAGRILLFATGKDMQQIEQKFGYSFIYKMEAGHRSICDRYAEKVLDNVQRVLERYQDGEEREAS